jgi:hypothetical protein
VNSCLGFRMLLVVSFWIGLSVSAENER